MGILDGKVMVTGYGFTVHEYRGYLGIGTRVIFLVHLYMYQHVL